VNCRYCLTVSQLGNFAEVANMPQGKSKLVSKRPKDVIVRADKEKLRKQTLKMKKGALKIAPKKKRKQQDVKYKEKLQKEFTKALEHELAEQAGTGNLKVVKNLEKKKH